MYSRVQFNTTSNFYCFNKDPFKWLPPTRHGRLDVTTQSSTVKIGNFSTLLLVLLMGIPYETKERNDILVFLSFCPYKTGQSESLRDPLRASRSYVKYLASLEQE